ncbi:hypothetical protein, partial [Pseudomonas mosselii]
WAVCQGGVQPFVLFFEQPIVQHPNPRLAFRLRFQTLGTQASNTLVHEFVTAAPFSGRLFNNQ